MQTYELILKSKASSSFRCQKAANSLDINVEEKLEHKFSVIADLQTDYNVGLVVGASGSGKTTFVQKVFGENCFFQDINQELPIIDQFPDSYSYDECAEILSGIGLTSVPCWLRPVKTLSNGQKFRALCALAITSDKEIILIDEWTSVVDRTVAKAMSHCVQKFMRKNNKKVVLCSCHYDVIEWLNPCWVIDCNKQTYKNRRSLWQDFKRTDKLRFTIKECNRSTWKFFSKYHYLSKKIAGGKNYFFGLYNENDEQIGFQAFTNYVPTRKGNTPIFHSNRVVIHPDYCGMGLGIKLTDACSQILYDKYSYKIMAAFSSTPMYKSRINNKKWKLVKVERLHGDARGKVAKKSKTFGRGNSKHSKGGFRKNVKIYSFVFIPVKQCKTM